MFYIFNIFVFMITKEKIKNAQRLVGEDGYFKSQYPGGNGKYSIGFLEEMCEFVIYITDLVYDEKLEKVLELENIIQKMLNGENSERAINYIPTWSTKLKSTKKDN